METVTLILSKIVLYFLFVCYLIYASILVIYSVEKESFNGVVLLFSQLAIVLTSYHAYLFFYFRSDKFNQIRFSIREHTEKCNDLNHHIEDLKKSYSGARSSDYGSAELSDTSRFRMKRRFWGDHIQSSHIHNCSASVLANARNQPLKYFCKYFNVRTNEASLISFEKVLNDFSAAEQGKTLLTNERDAILDSIKNSIPRIISYFSKDKLMAKLGFEHVDLSDFYFPAYRFQYVSTGGNSSSNLDIRFDIENLEKIIVYLSDLITFKNSVAGQRALMTRSLREKIKTRDNFTCQHCGLSVHDERNLLLEIDHIRPLSKGGITSEDNLQTLCWKCNRSKGSKIQNPQANAS